MAQIMFSKIQHCHRTNQLVYHNYSLDKKYQHSSGGSYLFTTIST